MSMGSSRPSKDEVHAGKQTPAFESDFGRLSSAEKRMFRDAVKAFTEACDRSVAARGAVEWPAALRVRDVEGAPGVWELTWSSSGPDGRATWQWDSVEVEDARYPAVLWRRVGGHAIFRD